MAAARNSDVENTQHRHTIEADLDDNISNISSSMEKIEQNAPRKRMNHKYNFHRRSVFTSLKGTAVSHIVCTPSFLPQITKNKFVMNNRN